MRNNLLIILSCLMCFSCVSSGVGSEVNLQKTSFRDLDGWLQDNHEEALKAFLKSCRKINALTPNEYIHKSKIGGKVKDWQAICRKAMRSKSLNAKRFFEYNFQPYLVVGKNGEQGLFTGYYEIALNGSKIKSDKYRYPIYRKPRDLVIGKKYYSRSEIESGILEGKNLEILWVDDPVKLFFLHVQGSGKIKLAEGGVVAVGFAAKNHHEYSSIGKYVIAQGYMKKEELNAESLKQFLYDNPQKQDEIFKQNDSYIFFREVANTNPIGGQGVEVTPLRTLAIDRQHIAYGMPLWVDVGLNKTEHYGGKLQRLMIAQDTGSAIKGGVRGDIFFGFGSVAEDLASYQNSRGKYYMLLPAGI